jgi:hypothetical protein
LSAKDISELGDEGGLLKSCSGYSNGRNDDYLTSKFNLIEIKHIMNKYKRLASLQRLKNGLVRRQN